MEPARCMVCGSAYEEGTECYANLWEKSQKIHPCCCEACAAKFNADVHWMPFEPPAPLMGHQLDDLMGAASGWLHAGQAPPTVARTLLTSGVRPAQVREALWKVMEDLDDPPVDPAQQRDRALTIGTALFSLVSFLFSGWFFIAGVSKKDSSSHANRDALRAAEAILVEWESRFAG